MIPGFLSDLMNIPLSGDNTNKGRLNNVALYTNEENIDWCGCVAVFFNC